MTVTSHLRLLETTDLHMHLQGYDFLRDQPSATVGLTHLIPLIEAARSAAPATLLFDNGDFLQGTPLAETAITDATFPHPMVEAFNALHYDAIGLGNHEFDYGLPVLQQVLADCAMPVVCANVSFGPNQPLVAPWTVITRDLPCSDGTSHTINIGVIGFVTPQLVDWDAHVLGGAVQTEDILSAARSQLPSLLRAGADIIVALCHSGISDAPPEHRMENAAVPLAAMPGIDVVLAGHTHELFPHPDFAGQPHVDAAAGTLHGKPAVMAGARGAVLGQIDLFLQRDPDGWAITAHKSQLLRPGPQRTPTPAQNALDERMAPLQAATLKRLRAPVCTTTRRLTSYRAAIGGDDTLPLVAAAQRASVSRALAGTAFADLPVLSAVAPYCAGGHGGPFNYHDIPPGAITLRHTTAIVPFNNPVAAVLRRGWQLRHWLEESSRYFRVIPPGSTDQRLINGQIAAYRFDTFFGLRYRIDLSLPPRSHFDSTSPARVRDVTWQGRRVADDDMFVVATSSYRARGGGGLLTAPPQDILHTTSIGLTDLVNAHLFTQGVPETTIPPDWSFVPMPGTIVQLASSPLLADMLTASDPLTATGEITDAGFALYDLPL